MLYCRLWIDLQRRELEIAIHARPKPAMSSHLSGAIFGRIGAYPALPLAPTKCTDVGAVLTAETFTNRDSMLGCVVHLLPIVHAAYSL